MSHDENDSSKTGLWLTVITIMLISYMNYNRGKKMLIESTIQTALSFSTTILWHENLRAWDKQKMLRNDWFKDK